MYPVFARPQAVAIRVPGTGADTATVESPPLRPFGNGRHEWRPYGRICNPSGYSYCLLPIPYSLGLPASSSSFNFSSTSSPRMEVNRLTHRASMRSSNRQTPRQSQYWQGFCWRKRAGAA